MLEFSLTGQEVSRRGSVGSDEMVTLLYGSRTLVCGVGSIGIVPIGHVAY
jgi:hypothetical protein